MMTPVGATAQWIAAARALETEAPDPLFVDPFARDLAGPVGFQLLGDTQPGGAHVPNPYFSIRTRFLDDAVLEVVREKRFSQVVIVAAGMDTRAFRLDWPAGVVVFEIDRQDVFDWKEPILQRHGASARADRRIVRTDVTDDWTGRLIAGGFDPARPAAFLLEGLVMYLHEPQVAALFTSLSTIAADGSWLALDAVNPETLTSNFTAGFLKKLEELGCGWYFGMPHPESFLARFGWQAEVVLPGEEKTRYGPRWKLPVIPRSVPGIPRTFFVTATKDLTDAGAARIGVILKRFEAPDEIRRMVKGKFEVVRVGGITLGRATYEPGWKWSEHVGPGLGQTRCTVEHVGIVVSGCATAAFDDGTVVELRAGQLFHIPPVPHDSWVVGDEPYVSLHFGGAEHYAKQGEKR